MMLWENVVPIRFLEVPVAASADILFSWGTGNHGDAYPFDGANGVLAHAFSPPPNGGSLAGDVHFDESETWTAGIRSGISQPIDLMTVAAHEIGHALGLGHSPSASALMYAYYDGSHRYLDSDDVIGIRSLYGTTPSHAWTSAYSDAEGWSASASLWQTLEFPDLNGDGKRDVCGRAMGGLYCALSNGSSFGTPSFWTSAYSDAEGWSASASLWQTLKFPDLNRDGRQDVCGRAMGGLYCALSNGGSFGTPSFWTSAYSDVEGWNSSASYWQTLKFPDLNGDGKQDACGRSTDGIRCVTR